ncbi:MAG TPA: type VI secretion system contractile sheath large subunit, partial [Sphingomicrobium sp.]
MAQEALRQTGATSEAGEAELDDFQSLLQKEFKPANDERKSRIEVAVQTLAQQALENTQVIGGDVFATVDAMRAALDRKLTEQINQIIH